MAGTPSRDRRYKPRVPVTLEADFKFGRMIGSATAVDLSESGAFLATRTSAPIGTTLFVRLYLDGRKTVIKSVANVRRIVPVGTGGTAGMGVEFGTLYAQDAAELEHFVRNRLGRALESGKVGRVAGKDTFKLSLREMEIEPAARPKGKAGGKFGDTEILEALEFSYRAHAAKTALRWVLYALLALVAFFALRALFTFLDSI